MTETPDAPPRAHCSQCGRVIELDPAGRLAEHWDTSSFTTDECPGSGQYVGGWPAFPPPTPEHHDHHEPRDEPEPMPWWAEHLLEQIVRLRADHRSAVRLERATRRALDALAQLGERPSS